MAQKTVYVPEIGELILSKRRGATHLRLSINAAGKVRVGMPYWAPYSSGIIFAKSKADWINKHLKGQPNNVLNDGDLIGKSHRLQYVLNTNQKTTAVKIGKNLITVTTASNFADSIVQRKIIIACEKALKVEAERLLPIRIKALAEQHGFEYKNIQIRKLIARWGSCSNTKVITLSYYLIQLPWDLIDYVLIHELIHTKHMHHGKEFWDEFIKITPKARILQKEIRTYKPLVSAYKIIPGN
jgi:predicted metal-dependent hydrolase